MYIGDRYCGGEIVGAQFIDHDGHDVMSVILACQQVDPDNDADVRYALHIEDISPLVRTAWAHESGHKPVWDALSCNIHDLLTGWTMTGDARAVSITLPAALAVLYDDNLRTELGRECGQQPVYQLHEPNRTFTYKSPGR